MSTHDDENEPQRALHWAAAKRHAMRGSAGPLITLLRQYHDPLSEVDLDFVADLLEGKFQKAKGRPSDDKLTAALKKLDAAQAVANLISNDGMSVEKAVAQAAKTLAMSESAIKKHYVYCRRHGLLHQTCTVGGDDA